jgi:hypothetical protein
MTVSNVSATQQTPRERPPAPKEITKAGLQEMKERITASGGTVPDGLDTLISKFDEAAGSSGKMTFSQFKQFASDNGVQIPEPGKRGGAGPSGQASQSGQAGQAGGAPPQGGAGRAQGSGHGGSGSAQKSSSSSSTSSSTSSTEDLTQLSDADLKARAAKGDAKALREIERRNAKNYQSADVGNSIDTYA